MILKCPQCGYPLRMKDKDRTFIHNLSKGLVKALMKAVRLGQKESKAYNIPVHPSELEGFSHFELANFQKLQYFNGLVLKHIEDGVFKRGYWLITRQGRDFIRGTYKVPKRVRTLHGKVVWKDSRLVGIEDFMKYFDEYWQKSFPAEVAGNFAEQRKLI